MPLVPDDVVLRALGDALGDTMDRLHRRQGLLADGVLVLDGLVPGVAQGRDHGTRGVAQRQQCVAEVLGDLFQTTRERQLHDPLEPLRRGLQGVGGLLVHQLRRSAHRTVDLAGVSSPVATPVTLETSSWASSTISTSCCGSTGAPSMASMARRA